MKRLFQSICFIGGMMTMILGSCANDPLIGEWKCYDFKISDTTGIPQELILNGIESAKQTTLCFNKDSSYQEDYIVEETEVISTIGNFSIVGDSIYLIPVKMGGKELTDPSEISYRYIANDENLSLIAQAKAYQFEQNGTSLILKDMIYNAASRSRTNQTFLYFSKNQ